MVSSRTTDRPHGRCRVYAPLSSTESGNEHYNTATFRSISPSRRQALSTFPLTTKMCLPPGRGQTGCPLCLVRRKGFCGAPFSRSSTACQLSLSSTSEPQMVDSVVDVLKILDHSLPGGKAGKATRVPWLFMRHALPRSSLPEPQVVEGWWRCPSRSRPLW